MVHGLDFMAHLVLRFANVNRVLRGCPEAQVNVKTGQDQMIRFSNQSCPGSETPKTATMI